MISKYRNAIYSVLFVLAVILASSAIANIAYIYTLFCLSALVAFGHLITLDDDMDGEWCNPDGNKKYWHESLVILIGKFVFVIFLLIIMIYFPQLSEYGA